MIVMRLFILMRSVKETSTRATRADLISTTATPGGTLPLSRPKVDSANCHSPTHRNGQQLDLRPDQHMGLPPARSGGAAQLRVRGTCEPASDHPFRRG